MAHGSHFRIQNSVFVIWVCRDWGLKPNDSMSNGKGQFFSLLRELTFGVPMRQFLPPALPGDPISGIVRRRSLLEPEPEPAQFMGQAPFVENSSGHGEGGTGQFRGFAAQRIIKQPFFKRFRLRVVFDRPLQ